MELDNDYSYVLIMQCIYQLLQILQLNLYFPSLKDKIRLVQ
jgi:hypothetical protein